MEQQDALINLILRGKAVADTGLATASGMGKKGKLKFQVLPYMGNRPIIPASQWSGAWRRSLSDEIVRAQRKHDRYPYDNLFSWFLNRQGGIASFSVPLKFGEMAEMRKKNAALALFGTGNLPSKMAIEAAVPEKTNVSDIVARNGGFRTDDLRRNSALAADLPPHFLDEYVLVRFGAQGPESAIAAFDALESGARSDNPVVRQAYDSLNGEEESVVDSLLENENEDTWAPADSKGFTSIINPYGGFEYFVPGTKFSHQITLLGLTRDEAAMAIGALYAWARRPVLGGHLKSGMGHVSCAYRVTTFDDDPLAVPSADGDLNIASFAARAADSDNPRPAFASTSPLVNDLLKHFLTLCANGFRDFDFNVGVASEKAGLKKARGKALEALETRAAKAAKAKKKDKQD